MDYPATISRLFDERASEAALSGDIQDMDLIAPGLYLGSQRSAGVLFPFEERDVAAASILRKSMLSALGAKGIRNIVCCSATDARIFSADGIAYECALLSDGSVDDILASTPAFSDLLDRAIALVAAARSRGEATLVHCASGAHRSASLLCGILMHEQRKALADILPLLLRQRPYVRPTFWRYLVEELEPRVLS